MSLAESHIQACSKECGLSLEDSQIHKLQAYFSLFQKWNSKISLSSVKDPETLLRLHLAEGLWVADRFLEGDETVVDLGSGGGLPGIPMLIRHPGCSFFLLERNAKKAFFLETVLRRLDLSGEVVLQSAESWIDWPRNSLVVCRAVRLSSSLLRILEQKAGLFLHLRGAQPHTQLEKEWEKIEERCFPLSEQRIVSLYRPCFT